MNAEKSSKDIDLKFWQQVRNATKNAYVTLLDSHLKNKGVATPSPQKFVRTSPPKVTVLHQ